ncbi:oxidative damage protection protein, partial [Pseudomonas aeruginosa]|nr:oxidative damage protection protein [Pseudomonas aeruginosa]
HVWAHLQYTSRMLINDRRLVWWTAEYRTVLQQEIDELHLVVDVDKFDGYDLPYA